MTCRFKFFSQGLKKLKTLCFWNDFPTMLQRTLRRHFWQRDSVLSNVNFGYNETFFCCSYDERKFAKKIEFTFGTWTRCLSYCGPFVYSCGTANCLNLPHAERRDSILSHTRFWLRSDHLLIDFLRNSFESRTGFKKSDDSCFATSSIPHVVVRFAPLPGKLNDKALFYHTLMFVWVVLPFSDIFGRKNPDYFCIEIYCCVLVLSNTSLC